MIKAMPTCLSPAMKLSIFLLAAIAASPAAATLGQPVTVPPTTLTGPSAGARLQAVRPSHYVVTESQLESGTSVREYSNVNGLVFAVDWSGPVIPDLDLILGAYFSVFQADTAQARSEGRYRAPVNVTRSDIVIRSNGRMRNFFGHAYVPSLVPIGLNIQDVLP